MTGISSTGATESGGRSFLRALASTPPLTRARLREAAGPSLGSSKCKCKQVSALQGTDMEILAPLAFCYKGALVRGRPIWKGPRPEEDEWQEELLPHPKVLSPSPSLRPADDKAMRDERDHCPGPGRGHM